MNFPDAYGNVLQNVQVFKQLTALRRAAGRDDLLEVPSNLSDSLNLRSCFGRSNLCLD